MTDPLDFDPATVPVRPAATVMLVDDRPVAGGEELHVLMVKRTARMVFAPAAWVFPGGRVDPDDHSELFNELCEGLSDAEASSILNVEHGGLAWWLAACRETLEEAGLLLGTSHGSFVDDDLVRRFRDIVRTDEGRFVDLLHHHDIAIDATLLEEVARFITPLGSPRRFDARFFLARAPHGQEPVHDDGEIVDWEWVRPADAMERWRSGEFEMISPTVRMVDCLTRYDRADAALAAAKRRLPYRRVRVQDPEGEYRVLLPGEPGYDEADLTVESGWVRLWEG